VDSMFGWWIALVGGSLVAGAATVAVLVARKSLERVFAIPALASLGVMAAAISAIAQHYRQPTAPLFAFAFALAAAGGGYALASTALAYLPARERGAELRPAPVADDRPCVILTACIEPPAYDPRITAASLQSLAEEDLIDASAGLLPFLFFGQKTRYESAGGLSPSAAQFAAVTERLEAALAPYSAQVEWATCSGPSSTAARVADAVARGHRRIVSITLAVAPDKYLIASAARVAAMRPAEVGVDYTDTGCLGVSERVAAMVASRVIAAVGSDREHTGVVLVCHGQPDERARDNAEFDNAETIFASRVRMLLVEQGLPEANVRQSWVQWAEPDVTSTVRHLAALGCSRVLVTPALFPLETLVTRLDLEAAARQARTDDSVSVVVLPTWRDDPAVIEALRVQVAGELQG